MYKIIPTLLLFCCSIPAFAQQELIHPKERTQHHLVNMESRQPLILVNDQQTRQNALILSPAAIENMSVLQEEHAKAELGEKAAYGAVLVQIKPHVNMVRLPEIYTHFHVPARQQQLKVVVDRTLIKDTELILADLQEIARVEVVKQDITAPIRWSLDDEEEFLRIIPKHQAKLK